MPAADIFPTAYSSSAERTSSHAKMLVNTWDLRNMMLWSTDLVSCAWLCVGVPFGKTCCCVTDAKKPAVKKGGPKRRRANVSCIF